MASVVDPSVSVSSAYPSAHKTARISAGSRLSRRRVEVRTTEVRMHRTDNFRRTESLADTWRSAGHVFGHFRSVLETYREDVG